MNTIEDFEKAPVGATATRADGGRAMKMNGGVRGWITPKDGYFSDVEMVDWGYTLENPAPTTAREALDLAWDLAHEVKPEQVIPKGTWYLQDSRSGLGEYVAGSDFMISHGFAPLVRTFDPLPEPKPDWNDAPAVIAATSMCPDRKVWVPQIYNPESGGVWKCSCCRDDLHWYELVDVVPLYPPNEGTMDGTEAPEGYTPSSWKEGEK